MAEIYFVTQHVNVAKLPHVFLLLVCRQRTGIGKLLADVSQLLVDSDHLLLFAPHLAELRDKVVQPSRLRAHN